MASQSKGRALRVGVVREGRILLERAFAPGESVTVGTGDACAIVVRGEGLPASHTLFAAGGSGYTLAFTAQMGGKVGLAGGSGELADLVQSGYARRAGDSFVVPLDDRSKGRIEIGDTTLIFQFVEPEAKAVKPVLPLSITSGGEVDWTFASFVLASFAFLFSVGLGLSQVDPVAETSVEVIPDDFVQMLVEEPDEPEVTEQTEQNPDEATPAEDTPRETAQNETRDSQNIANNAEAQASLADDVANEVMNEILGMQGGDASDIVRDVLGGHSIGGDLSEQLAGGAVVGVGGSGSRAIREAAGGGGSGTTGALGVLDRGGAVATSMDTQDMAETRVRGSTRAASPTVTGGAGDFDTSQVTARLRSLSASMNRCYEQQLAVSPSLEGRVGVRFTILESGSVTGINVDGGTPALQQCVSSVLGRLRFNPGPTGGSVNYSTSFVFTPGN